MTRWPNGDEDGITPLTKEAEKHMRDKMFINGRKRKNGVRSVCCNATVYIGHNCNILLQKRVGKCVCDMKGKKIWFECFNCHKICDVTKRKGYEPLSQWGMIKIMIGKTLESFKKLSF